MKFQGLHTLAADTVLSLLSIQFEAHEGLAGSITLNFSNAISLRLQVSCINAALDDLGGTWGTAKVPDHHA